MPFVTTRINTEVESIDRTGVGPPKCTNKHTVLIEDGIRHCWRKIAEGPPLIPVEWRPSRTPALDLTLDLNRPLPELPNELIDKILGYAIGRYVHEAILTTTPNHGHPFIETWHDQGSAQSGNWLSFSSPESNSDQGQRLQIMDDRHVLGVYKRRDWVDIPSYYLSRTFRQGAIRHYGRPTRQTFPYNPQVDSLIVKEDEHATFMTGFPAVSSVIPDCVDVFTIIPFDHRHPDVVIDCTYIGSPILPKSQYIINLAYNRLVPRIFLARLRDSHHDDDRVLRSPKQVFEFLQAHRQTSMSGHLHVHLDEIMAWLGWDDDMLLLYNDT